MHEHFPCLRFSRRGNIILVDEGNGAFHVPSQEEMDSLPTGSDLSWQEQTHLDAHPPLGRPPSTSERETHHT